MYERDGWSPCAASLLLFLVAVGLTAAISSQARVQSFAVDRTQSRALIQVGKSGALSFMAGHTHEVMVPTMTGIINVDSQDLSRSQVRVEIDAAALKVTGKGDPPKDVPEVQRVMSSEKVLDVERYPKILFQSTNISVKSRTDTTVNLLVTGTLALHNVIGSLSVPVQVALAAGTLTASGRFPVKQTDYGIKPVSVGGVVAVKDSVDITFTIVAREQSGG
jgi:polyisoprenoid-binding protein YceI